LEKLFHLFLGSERVINVFFAPISQHNLQGFLGDFCVLVIIKKYFSWLHAESAHILFISHVSKIALLGFLFRLLLCFLTVDLFDLFEGEVWMD